MTTPMLLFVLVRGQELKNVAYIPYASNELLELAYSR